MGAAVPVGSASRPSPPPDLNPAAISIKLPSQIQWTESADGNATAVLYGDPAKPGLYIMLMTWHAHHNSHPHFHLHDRYVTVLSGTWWVNTGSKYDPDQMVPLPTGSYVVHHAMQIHYDGAKDADTTLEIVGEGPAALIPAEDK
jgi:quercetin dioxygenase-like cupin family protein